MLANTAPRFRQAVGEAPVDAAALRRYVDGLGAEWWQSEFKTCELDVGYGLRKSVAAMANGRGGEVFVGVTDTKEVRGSAAPVQRVEQELAQRGDGSGDGFLIDLNQTVGFLTAVPASGSTTAYVLEVSPSPLAALVLEPGGGEASIHVRRSASSVKLDGVGALRWSRELSRERLLLAIFREFRTMVQQVRIAVNHDLRVDSGFLPRLPLLGRSLENGSFYDLLSEADIKELLGRRTSSQQGDTSGHLSRYLDLPGMVELTRSRVVSPFAHHGDERAVVEQLQDLPRQLELDVEGFRLWLVQQRILPNNPT